MIYKPFQKSLGQYKEKDIAIKIGNVTINLHTMITIRGHIQLYNSSFGFEVFVYLYPQNPNNINILYSPYCFITNKSIIREVYFALDSNNQLWLIFKSASDIRSIKNNYINIFIDELFLGYQDTDDTKFLSGWDAKMVVDMSEFTYIQQCKDSSLPNWIDLNLLNGWENYNSNNTYDSLQCCLKDGIVYCRGLIKHLELVTEGKHLICLLPEGYRPIRNCIFSVRAGNKTSNITLDISPSGYIGIRYSEVVNSSVSWVSLNQVTFAIN